nr:phage terminase large subunit [Bacillus licheniformis]
MALKLILKLLEEKRTVLVIREVYDTHRDSTFSHFEGIINDLEIDHIVRCMTSPMQVRFPNGEPDHLQGAGQTGQTEIDQQHLNNMD